ncbi:hypothetical protein D9757_008007 [Collybiopsis confluens]|uniref:F-box domain-containing protein n=1 Tax=Collybiopsis confluens TaxID=2823264 RepID=A0A8H5H5U4_9AGAR|nr:hypothetical protein D9757_008007 [Collybiopsis confluens]
MGEDATISQMPAEILTRILGHVCDEDVIFQYGLPTVMAEAAWFKNALDEWALRSPQEAINTVQRRSYADKKAIMLTCKTWCRLGSEFLYRCLFFDNPFRLIRLCENLESDAKTREDNSNPGVGLGWWTRRLHLNRYYASPNRGISQDEMSNALTTIIKHCPNLSIFIVEWPMPSPTFGLVVDTLSQYTHKALHTVHWNVPAECISKVIWALDSLPLVLAAHIEFAQPTPTTDYHESLHLGSAQDITLDLPYLQQLTLRGSFAEFLEQAMGWHLPGLRNLSLDSGNIRTDTPDIIGFLEIVGKNLNVLDINAIPALDVPEILELCPKLEVFSFNADWRLQSPALPSILVTGDDNEEEEEELSPQQRRQKQHNETHILTHTPHPRIHTIGLHGLLYAFGVGFSQKYASEEPLKSRVIRRSNDLNFAALNRAQFPHLHRIRVLSRTLLNDLNKANGPSQEDGVDGMDRWERWWNACTDMGMRLEDATGGELGELPEDDGEDTDEDDDENDQYSSEGYSDEDEWEVDVPSVDGNDEAPHVLELRQLIRECQAMAEDREESPFTDFIGPALYTAPPTPESSAAPPNAEEKI